MPPMRTPSILLLLPLISMPIRAQTILGRFDPPRFPDRSIQLLGTRGLEHPVIDSARVDGKGAFIFPAKDRTTGFYQLATTTVIV